MILIPILALFVGLILGRFLSAPIEPLLGTYLAIAALAGMDTLFGGIRSAMETKFRSEIFVTGFVSNVLVSCLLAWLGDQIGINLFLAAAIILGTRIFSNISLMRRLLFNRLQESRRRKTLAAEHSAVGVQ